MQIILRGSQGSGGTTEGDALVYGKPFEFGDVDPRSGIVNIAGHQLEGESVKDKILVFPCGCGATTEEWSLYILKKFGVAPNAVVTMSIYPCAAIGGIIAGIPMVSGFDSNLMGVIETGDHVKVDGKNRLLKVEKRSH